MHVTAANGELHPSLRFKIDGIGHDAVLITSSADGATHESPIGPANHREAIDALINALDASDRTPQINAIGHRIVHGMQHSQPQLITSQLCSQLKQLGSLDPEHVPFELELVDVIQHRFPDIPQVACFDTAFHRDIPDIAKTLALPQRYRELGMEHYGFHGLSYSYLLDELSKIDTQAAHNGRVIIAHLGNGASLAAIRNGICIDTSMSFSPASGIMMSTRSGDIDPGVVYYLSNKLQMEPDQLQHMLNHESGMLGVSGISGDVRELLKVERENKPAALALNMFCYQVRKYVGAYAAALGGVDTLVFSGGIGENAAEIRERICSDLQFLNIRIDHQLNAANARLVSTADSIPVRVMPTDEELMIARLVVQLLNSRETPS